MNDDESRTRLSASKAYFCYFIVFIQKSSCLWSLCWCYRFSGTALLYQSNSLRFMKNLRSFRYMFFWKILKVSFIHATTTASFRNFGKNSFGCKEKVLISHQKRQKRKFFGEIWLRNLSILEKANLNFYYFLQKIINSQKSESLF